MSEQSKQLVFLACRSKLHPESDEEAFIKIDAVRAARLCKLPGYRLVSEQAYLQHKRKRWEEVGRYE